MSDTEIESVRKTVGRELVARLYFLPAYEKLILAPVYRNFEGADYEQGTAELVSTRGSIPPEGELGRRARETLLRCERKDRNLRGQKASEWPAYRESGLKGIKQFEKACFLVEVTTLPSTIEVEARPPLVEDLHVGGHLPLGADDADLGALILRVMRCCQKLHADHLA